MPGANVGSVNRTNLGNNFVYKDGEKIEEISSLQHAHTYPTWTHSVNGYYNGVFGQWNVDFNADYLLGKIIPRMKFSTMMIKPLNLKMKSGTICMLCVWL